MAASRIGNVRATLIQKRSVILASSEFCSLSPEMSLGSSAIPQIGHDPGSGRTISECIGQTYSVFTDAASGIIGSKAIPHLGHAPGSLWRTSGSMGQT